MKIISYPSPNFNERLINPGEKPDMIILHHTNMDSAESALKRLVDPESNVSCHYLIHKNGTVYQLVDERERAWHAGIISAWKDRERLNSFSIGIELDSLGDAFTKPQMEALVLLIQDIRTRYHIPNTHILGHSDIAPDRKDDPSEHFDWEYLAEQGIGCMPENVEILKEIPSMEDIEKTLGSIGYRGERVKVIQAFQRHFRRRKVDGIVDLETASIMKIVEKLYS
jgi:N-acetylmuramoyl-L-alanine amidase